MIVVEKTRDIGVLKALGAPGRGVASIFLGYGLLLGAVGSGVGAILGLLFVWNINGLARVVEKVTGREVFDPTVYYFNTIPTVIHPFMIVWVVAGAMLIAVLASVLPSIRAARMHPVEPYVMNNSSTATKASQPDGVEPRVRLRTFPPQDETNQEGLISAVSLHKSYRKGKLQVPVLRGVDFHAEAGKVTAIVGQSGSGKSTLLHLLGTLDAPDSGEVRYDGNRIDNLSNAQRDAFRNQQLGMIFQFYHLLPELSMLENVMVPQMIVKGSGDGCETEREFVNEPSTC